MPKDDVEKQLVLDEVHALVSDAQGSTTSFHPGRHAKRLSETYPNSGLSEGRIVDEIMLAASIAGVAMELIPGQLGIARRALNVIWDAGSMGGDAMAHLLEREPTIAKVLDEVVRGCPIAETARTFAGEHFERPRGHARSFLLRLREGVLVFKGTELFSSDYREILEEAWQKRELGRYSAMDHFAIAEDEVYLGLTKRLAIGGAQRTWAWVSAHTDIFRDLPRTPFPLLVLEVPDNVTQEFGESLLPLLSDRLQYSAKKKVEGLLRDGLCVYVYYYHGMPIRLAHALGSFPGSFGVGSNDGPPLAFDIDAAVVSWTDMFARMLVAGFVPTTPVHTGNCLQSQNVVIDGGLCDVDSIEPIALLPHRRDLASALSASLTVLTQTVSSATSLPNHVTAAYLWAEILRRTREMAHSVPCDPRVAELVELEGLAGLRWFARATAG